MATKEGSVHLTTHSWHLGLTFHHNALCHNALPQEVSDVQKHCSGSAASVFPRCPLHDFFSSWGLWTANEDIILRWLITSREPYWRTEGPHRGTLPAMLPGVEGPPPVVHCFQSELLWSGLRWNVNILAKTFFIKSVSLLLWQTLHKANRIFRWHSAKHM